MAKKNNKRKRAEPQTAAQTNGVQMKRVIAQKKADASRERLRTKLKEADDLENQLKDETEEDPEIREEYEAIRRQIQKDTRILKAIEDELNEDMPDAPVEGNIKTEGENSRSGVIRSVERDTPSARPNRRVAFGNGTAEDPLRIDDELDLVTQQSQAASEGRGLQRKPVAWKNQGGNTSVTIVRYGPLNTAKYRRERGFGGNEADVPDLTDPKSRLGEDSEYKKIGTETKKVWARTHREYYLTIQGVAFEEKPGRFRVPEDAVNPAKKGRSGRFAPTEIWVKWKHKTTGTIDKSWETRAAFKRIWPSNDKTAPDRAIYDAAKIQEKRYKEWEQHERRTLSRSPSAHPKTSTEMMGFSRSPEPERSAEQDSEDGETDDEGTDDEGTDDERTDGEGTNDEGAEDEETDDENYSGRKKGKKRQSGVSTRAKGKQREEGPSTRAKGKQREEGPSTRAKGKQREVRPSTRAKGKKSEEGPSTRAKGKERERHPEQDNGKEEDEWGAQYRREYCKMMGTTFDKLTLDDKGLIMEKIMEHKRGSAA